MISDVIPCFNSFLSSKVLLGISSGSCTLAVMGNPSSIESCFSLEILLEESVLKDGNHNNTLVVQSRVPMLWVEETMD